MNLVSALVGLSIAGTAMPMVTQMSLAPVMTQKKAANFSVAESKAVAYSAKNEGLMDWTPIPNGCTDPVPLDDDDTAFMITCIEGEGVFRQSASRSFRLAPLEGSIGSSYTAPVSYTPGTFCPLWDPWGVINYNDSHNVQCIPVPYGPWASTYNGEMLW
jgi:hypothetical protein